MDHLSVLAMSDGLVNCVRLTLIIVHQTHPSMALVMISEQPAVLTAIQHYTFAPALLVSLATTVQTILTNVIPILVKMELFAQTFYMDHSSVLVMSDGLVNFVM
jgi:hypothetical protein